MKYLIDKQYAIAPETKTFIISGNQYISFTLIFKYLGSWISYDLDDVKRENQVMGALKWIGYQKRRPSLQILNLHGCSLKASPLGL